MGWKNVKEAYRVEHLVCVNDKGICIGSPYIHDIIVIGMDGVLKKRYSGNIANLALQRYQREMDDYPEELKRLVLSPDEFHKSITVYTFEDGEIVEKLCEKTGWPNVTHDGMMMYGNQFFTDKADAIEQAKIAADMTISAIEEVVTQMQKDIAERLARLEKIKSNRAKLETMNL